MQTVERFLEVEARQARIKELKGTTGVKHIQQWSSAEMIQPAIMDEAENLVERSQWRSVYFLTFQPPTISTVAQITHLLFRRFNSPSRLRKKHGR